MKDNIFTPADCLEKRLTCPTISCSKAFAIARNVSIQAYPNEIFRSSDILQIICTSGSFRCLLSDRICLLNSASVMLILPGMYLRIIEISDDFKCTFTRQSVDFAESQNVGEEYLQFEQIIASPVHYFTAEEYASVNAYCELLEMTIRTQTGQRCEEILRHLAIANHLANAAFLHQGTIGATNVGGAKDNRDQELMLQFTHLLNIYYTKKHELAFYADQLCLTAKYLSRCVMHASRHPAGWWIDYYLLRDADIYLRQTHLGIKEIASLLGFVDQSAFGKWFKRQRNISPQAYRKGNESHDR